MKKGFTKRALAFILTFALVLTYSAPVSVFADSIKANENNATVVSQGDPVKYTKDGSVTTGNDWVVSTQKQVKAVTDGTGEDGELEVTLTVQTKPDVQKTVETVTEIEDAATVLVFDTSSSMEEVVSTTKWHCTECGDNRNTWYGMDEKNSKGQVFGHTHREYDWLWGYYNEDYCDTKTEGTATRLDIAKEAANNFLASYVKNAGDAKRMVAIVEFGENGYTLLDWTNANAGNDQVATSVTTAVNALESNFSYSYYGNENISYQTTQSVDTGKWHCTKCGDAKNTWYDMDAKNSKGEEYGHTHGRKNSCEKQTKTQYKCTFPGCEYSNWQDVKITCKHPEIITKYDDKDDNGVGTNLEAGMILAKNLLAGRTAVDEVKNTIVLTDGVPTYYVTDNNATTSTSFITGTKGGRSKANETDYEDIPGLCKVLKDMKSDVYSLAFGIKDEVNSKTADKWLTEDVKVTKNYNATDATELFNSFADITKTITNEITNTTESSAIEVTETLASDSYLTYVTEGTGLKIGSHADAEYALNGNTLTWKPINGTTDGDITTYVLQYRIKLNQERAGFNENTTYNTGKPTISFNVGDKTFEDRPFDEPTVKGVIPTVGYTINFYKKSKTTGEFEAVTADQITGTAKVNTTVSVADRVSNYETKYTNYQLASEPSKTSLTLGMTENVMNIYYTPIETAVTVNHYYKTDVTNEDNTKTAGKYVMGSNSGVVAGTYYVGDEFTAAAETTHDFEGANITYKEDSRTSSKITLSTNGENNVIDIYYSASVDKRATASYVVYRQYETGKYELNQETGRYVKKYDIAEPQEFIRSSGDVRAFDSVTTSVTEDVTSGYTYNRTENSTNGVNYDESLGTVTMPLQAGENSLTAVFRSEPAALTPAKVYVVHEYTRNETYVDAEGKVITRPAEEGRFQQTVELTGYFVGEYFTPAELNSYTSEYGAETYVSDSGNKSKAEKTKITTDTVYIHFNYSLTVLPKEATATVQHHYMNQYYITDEAGETKTVIREDLEAVKAVTYPETGSVLYVGQKFVPTLVDKAGYSFLSADGTETAVDTAQAAKILADGENVINIYYLSKAVADERDNASVHVKFTYITHLETVIGGRVATTDQSIMLEEQKEVSGKVGDDVINKITALVKSDDYAKYDGKTDWSLKTVLADSYKLKRTNEGIEVIFERNDSNLKTATLKVVYRLIDKFMSIKDNKPVYLEEDYQVNDPAVPNNYVFAKNPADETKTITLGGDLYEGETYSLVVPTDKLYVNLPNEVLEYNRAKDDGTPTDITLAEGDNSFTYIFEREIELPKTTVTVVRHLEDININTVGESTYSYKDVEESPVTTVYAGQSVDILGGYAGYDTKGQDWKQIKNAESDSIDGNGTITVLTSTAAVTVDLFYTHTTNNSKPTTGRVEHHFYDVDWDGTVTENTDKYQETPISAYETQSYTATVLENTGYDFNTEKSDDLTITLGAAEGNVIVLKYYNNIDTRVEKAVTVNHYYYKHDDSGLIADDENMHGTKAGEYQQIISSKDDGAWVGNTLSIDFINEFGANEAEKTTYDFDFACGGVAGSLTATDGAVKYVVSDKEDANTIDIYYIYNYDASENVKVAVTYVYTATDVYTGTTTSESAIVIAEAKDGSGIWDMTKHTFTAEDAVKAGYTRTTSDDNMTIKFHSGDNAMTVEYERTFSTKPSKGGRPVDIPDDEVPLGDLPEFDIPDSDVPLGDAPDEFIIEDEEVPLGDLPVTGGMGVGLFLLAGAALAGAGASLRRKDEE